MFYLYIIINNKELMELLTITAIDKHSSDMTGRTFNAGDGLKEAIEEWEKELPYRRYELMCDDFVEDASILEILDDLEITF